ncbi:MAG TPA: hypothetical protein PK894_01510 [Defluviitoga sp.]|nr:hypothetical protein [Defluviitoga sp.]HOP25172.1 hypothetical protein [Defluviitoga sp.]HPZ28372.1 hypothetical protein [Defluviitoga sp.]HQD62262.1 hypothetical protein [Defluviitoga sp.]
MFTRFLLSKFHYWVYKKDIFSSLEALRGHKRISKDILGIYMIQNLNLKSMIKSFTKGLGEGFYVFFYFTPRKILKHKIKTITEVTNIYGVHFILFSKNSVLRIFDNECYYIDSHTPLKERIFSISSSKISFLLPEEINNPAVIMTLKMQDIDVVFSANISSYFNQDLSNNLIAYVITNKNIYVPDLFEKNVVLEKTNEKIKLDLKYLKSIRNNYLETNYKDLTLIKSKLDSIQV